MINLIARGKINLYLEIIGHRPDGYHELVMIMQSIQLADKLQLEPSDHISITCNHPEVPTDATNLAYKAALLMQKQFNRTDGVKIVIDKQIPVAAGLAGGSSNAAAVLVGINQLWQLGLTQEELQVLGAKIGSDVPFSLLGGTAMATGRGEKLDSIPHLDSLWVVLAKYQSLSVSTPWAYKTYRQQFSHEYVSDSAAIQSRIATVRSGPLVQAIMAKDGAAIGKLLHNDLEKVVLPVHGQVEKVRSVFAEARVLGTMMSGSGPTVFALCQSEVEAEEVKERTKNIINDSDLDFWVTKLASRGIEIGYN